MLNNKHWVSDILVGAGIGILVVELVYYLEPFKYFNPFEKVKRASIIPFINNIHYGIYIQISF